MESSDIICFLSAGHSRKKVRIITDDKYNEEDLNYLFLYSSDLLLKWVLIITGKVIKIFDEQSLRR